MAIFVLPGKRQAHNLFRPEGHPNGRHSGWDHGWADGYEVFAAHDGVVVSVYDGGGFNGGWGNRIVIEHAPGIRTTYNHLKTGTQLVKAGDKVTAGQRISTIGNTAVKDAHLHFEVYVNGVRVDPMAFFQRDLISAPSAPAAPDGPFVNLPSWWYTYSSAADAKAGRFQRGVGVGPGRFRIRGNDGGAILIETNRGNVWLHPKANAHITGVVATPPTPAPAAPAAPGQKYVTLTAWWYSYPTHSDAIAGRFKKGVGVKAGRYPLVGTRGGAVQINTGSGLVWLHPKAATNIS